MQDRFKFKVLDTNTNKLYSDMDSLSKEEPNAHFLLAQDGEIIKKYYNNGEIQLIRMSQYKPVFCTGLRDKNSKLIYEGDIVRSDEYPYMSNEQDNYYAEICWAKESAQFFYYTFKNPKFNDVSGISTGNTGNLDEHNWEVIGNIYENPELLNKEDK